MMPPDALRKLSAGPYDDAAPIDPRVEILRYI